MDEGGGQQHAGARERPKLDGDHQPGVALEGEKGGEGSAHKRHNQDNEHTGDGQAQVVVGGRFSGALECGAELIRWLGGASRELGRRRRKGCDQQVRE